MSDISTTDALARPVLTHCEWGGWLAVSDEQSRLRIGVVGATEALAREAFDAALRRWERLEPE